MPYIKVGEENSGNIDLYYTLKVYPGAPHGLTATHKDQVNADLLAFIKW